MILCGHNVVASHIHVRFSLLILCLYTFLLITPVPGTSNFATQFQLQQYIRRQDNFFQDAQKWMAASQKANMPRTLPAKRAITPVPAASILAHSKGTSAATRIIELTELGCESPGRSYKIRPSDIDGDGVFACQDLVSGQQLGIAINRRQAFSATALGEKINHRYHHNAYLERQPSDCDPMAIPSRCNYFLTMLQDLAAGQEVTINYDCNPPWFLPTYGRWRDTEPPEFMDTYDADKACAQLWARVALPQPYRPQD